MARALRLEFEGAIYHVTTRGNDRQSIFRSDQDRTLFLKKLSKIIQLHDIRLYAYVLMKNHYHFVLETPRANLSSFMQQFNTSYTMYFNRRYQRSGHLFSGRFKAKLVEGDRYLLNLIRYVHLNPIKTQEMSDKTLAEKQHALRNFPWSSYPAYAGLSPQEDFMDYEPLNRLVAKKTGPSATQTYQAYVESGLATDDKTFREILTQSNKAIGGREFCLQTEQQYKNAAIKGCQLDVAFRRIEIGIKPERVLQSICTHYSIPPERLQQRRNATPARLLTMKLLKEDSGLSYRNIAKQLGLSDGSGISRHLTKLEEILRSNSEIKEDYQKIRKRLYNH